MFMASRRGHMPGTISAMSTVAEEALACPSHAGRPLQAVPVRLGRGPADRPAAGQAESVETRNIRQPAFTRFATSPRASSACVLNLYSSSPAAGMPSPSATRQAGSAARLGRSNVADRQRVAYAYGRRFVLDTAATPLRCEYKESSAWRLRFRRPLMLPTRPTRDLGSNGSGHRSLIAGVLRRGPSTRDYYGPA
jgi:hypothetical protein